MHPSSSPLAPSDILDRRRFLIVIQIGLAMVSGTLMLLAWRQALSRPTCDTCSAWACRRRNVATIFSSPTLSHMKLYLISLGAGILVGTIYALMQVRSPAPPAIALIGLLGMLIGEQVVPPFKRMLAGEPVTIAWFRGECVPKITGTPPPNADTNVETSASLPARSKEGNQ